MVAGQAVQSVLVVEDDPQIAGVLTDLLEHEGYRVATGVNGQGLEAALADPLNMILLDVMMPGMNGIEVCRRLKSDSRTQDVPIVFITAMPIDVLTAQLDNCPYEGVIRKPFLLAEVVETVRHHVGG